MLALIAFSVVPALALDVPVRTITVDGQPGDWAGIPPVLTDPSDDSTCGSGTDIVALYLCQDDSFLYWRIDTVDGSFNWNGQDGPKGPGVTFYSITNGQVFAGVSASIQGDPGAASISVQYPGPDWTHLATCPRYGEADQVAEGKIPLILFNGFVFNTVYAWYSSGVGATFCDEAQFVEELLLVKGQDLVAPTQLSPEDGYTTENTSVLLEWTSGNGANEVLEIFKDGSLYFRNRACGKKLLENLSCGNYYWRVRSCVGTDCFDWSPWRAFTIECPPEPTPTPKPKPTPSPFPCDTPTGLTCERVGGPGESSFSIIIDNGACILDWNSVSCIERDGYEVDLDFENDAADRSELSDESSYLLSDCPARFRVRCLDGCSDPTSDWSEWKNCGGGDE